MLSLAVRLMTKAPIAVLAVWSPPRDETEIDTEAPTVSRTDSDVLAGLDKVDIKLNDEIGVQGVSAYLWIPTGRCLVSRESV